LAIPISIAITATNAPALIKRIGYKRVLMFAPLIVAGGLFWLAHAPLNGNYWTDILPGFVLMGLGMGFTFVSTTIAATSGVSADKSGLASGLLNTSQQLGGSLGLAILAGIASSVATSYMKDHMTMSIAASPEAGKLALANATLHGYHAGFYAATGFALAASLFATFVIHHAKGGADPVAEPVVAAH
jgi:MFS family permease